MKHELTANRLRQAMRAKGLRQQQLSDQSGVTKSSISHYINGKNVPDNFQAAKMAKVLEVAPEWLMGIDEMQNYIVVENTELQREITGLNENQIKRLLLYVRKLKEEKENEI